MTFYEVIKIQAHPKQTGKNFIAGFMTFSRGNRGWLAVQMIFQDGDVLRNQH